MIRKLLIITTLISVSGCVSMNDKFSCPLGPAGGCISVSEANQKVANGQLAVEPINNKHKAENKKIRQVKLSGEILPLFSNPPPPIRATEKVIKVWIAPFEDTDGDYHGASLIFTVIKNSHWLARPIKEMQQD